jgi:hypothetical protein
MSCLALDSQRPDVFLLPLENPQQTSACDYQVKYSPQSPKFSRAMAVVQGHFVTTLVSGTASIVNAKTCHFGDVVRQTEQTIDNIQRLIAPENFACHGLPGAGATLKNIALGSSAVAVNAPAIEAALAPCSGIRNPEPKAALLITTDSEIRSAILLVNRKVASSQLPEHKGNTLGPGIIAHGICASLWMSLAA